MSVKKITVITGVCGTTGSQILDYLASENEEVFLGQRVIVGVDNLFRGCMDNIRSHLNKDYFIYQFSSFENAFLSKTRDGRWLTPAKKVIGSEEYVIDEIYHMAAVVPTKYFYESPDLTYKVNCKGTIDLFDWARENGVKRFIVGSSSEIYGHIKDEDIPAKETTMSHFDSEETSTRWSYAQGKLLTEHYLNHFKDDMERVCHLRFANTYGPRDMDDNHILPYLVNCVVNGREIHINKNSDLIRRTFLSNKDSARACVELMSKGRNGIAYNVGSEEEVTIDTLLGMIVSIASRQFGIDTSKIKIVRDISRPGDPIRRVLDTSRLKEDTGFCPKVSLHDGISEMIRKAIKMKEDKDSEDLSINQVFISREESLRNGSNSSSR